MQPLPSKREVMPPRQPGEEFSTGRGNLTLARPQQRCWKTSHLQPQTVVQLKVHPAETLLGRAGGGRARSRRLGWPRAEAWMSGASDTAAKRGSLQPLLFAPRVLLPLRRTREILGGQRDAEWDERPPKQGPDKQYGPTAESAMRDRFTQSLGSGGTFPGWSAPRVGVGGSCHPGCTGGTVGGWGSGQGASCVPVTRAEGNRGSASLAAGRHGSKGLFAQGSGSPAGL